MDGQMVLSLDAEPVRLQCKGDIEYICKYPYYLLIFGFLIYKVRGTMGQYVALVHILSTCKQIKIRG